MARPSTQLRRWQKTITLKSGERTRLRPIRAEDAPSLVAGFTRLSPETIYYRFFSPRSELSLTEATHLATVNYKDRMAFVVERPPSEEDNDTPLIAIARYEPCADDPTMVEMAIVIGDPYQHQGLGLTLIRTLADYALAQGYTTMCAAVLSDNYRMLALLERTGYPQQLKYEGTVAHSILTLVPSKKVRTAA
jgi:RimJ/RimL family protein N-acetyltransferase